MANEGFTSHPSPSAAKDGAPGLLRVSGEWAGEWFMSHPSTMVLLKDGAPELLRVSGDGLVNGLRPALRRSCCRRMGHPGCCGCPEMGW